MKTAIIAMLPALLLCSAAQAQLGGVTDTAGSTVEQVGDPALAGQIGSELNTSRFGGPRSRIETLRARQAERAARRAGQAAAIESQTRSSIQGQAETSAGIAGSQMVAGAHSDAAPTAQAAAGLSAEAAVPAETSLQAAVRQQLAEVQASSAARVPQAPAASARLTATAPTSARAGYVARSSAPASGYRTTHRETVIVRDPLPAAQTQASHAAAEIRVATQASPRAAAVRSGSAVGTGCIWPLIIAGLLIVLLLGLARRFGQRQRPA